MYEGRRILALIPARGGSKGLPGKNVLPLAGKPLIAWTVEQALASTFVDRVVVSTDDSAIAKVAAAAGADVPFMRPPELASETSPTMDAVRHALEALAAQGDVYDYLALLEPTSPLRRPGDIDGAIAALLDAGDTADTLVSVGKVHLEHPSVMKLVEGGRLVPYSPGGPSVTRRQDLVDVYFPYGVIYLARVAAVLEAGSFYQERTIPWVIDRWQNYEIDDVYDHACVEAVLLLREKGTS
jgi:CMP-N,N'-diacetyllegionaminic acid synthase